TATTTPCGSTKASATSPPKTNTPAEAKPSAPPAKPASTPLTTPELRSTGSYAKIPHRSGGWVLTPPPGAFSQTHLAVGNTVTGITTVPGTSLPAGGRQRRPAHHGRLGRNWCVLDERVRSSVIVGDQGSG